MYIKWETIDKYGVYVPPPQPHPKTPIYLKAWNEINSKIFWWTPNIWSHRDPLYSQSPTEKSLFNP